MRRFSPVFHAMQKSETRFSRFLAWRARHVSDHQLVYLLAFLTGLLASVAAWLLKLIISLIQTFVTQLTENTINWWYLLLPAVGITIASVYVRRILRDDISHGVTKILYAISQHKAIIKLHNVYSSIIASSITIGFGGSVGAEAPMVLTGAAIGSNLGRLFRLDQHTLMLLVGCGAAGALGGIFKAPIAGVTFVMEVLLIDFTMNSIIPILITSVTATAFAYLFSGSEPLFPFVDYAPFTLGRVPAVILLGVVCGLVSLYFTRGMNFLEGVFGRIHKPVLKLLVGGSMLGVLIFFFPPLYGEGYDSITALLGGNPDRLFSQSLFYNVRSEAWALVLFFGLIIFFKIFATAATNGAGGTGGIFAPSLFVGCITGYVVAELLNLLGFDVPYANFAFAGMAGLMSAVMHAPLTGIFLIAELTGGYELFMTLMITSVVAYLTIILFEPHSLYAMRLAQKGELLTHHKDRAVLTLMKIDNVIETDLVPVTPEMTLGELVRVISKSHRNIFPVVEPYTDRLVGIVNLDEIRNIMFQTRLYDRFTVYKLMSIPPAKILQDMPMDKVMDIFETSGAWNLPVVDGDGRYLGFVSKSKIFNIYRDVLVNFSEE